MYLFPTVSVLSGFGSSAPVRQRRLSESSMKKELKVKEDRDLRQEYDLSKMRGAVRGKYYRRADGNDESREHISGR